jgi:hypothetical protein
VKPTQKCTTITQSNTVFDVSAQYDFLSMIKCSKNSGVRLYHVRVLTEKKLVHCITNNE